MIGWEWITSRVTGDLGFDEQPAVTEPAPAPVASAPSHGGRPLLMRCPDGHPDAEWAWVFNDNGGGTSYTRIDCDPCDITSRRTA